MLTRSPRDLADGRQPADRKVAQRQAQVRFSPGLDGMIQPHPLDSGVNLFAWKQPAFGAGRVGATIRRAVNLPGILE